jgi:peptide/nickel transport system substrate-binding protein
VTAPFLAGCTDNGASPDAAPAGGPPSRGGRLRVGALGAAMATLSPVDVQGNADFLAVLNVFDSLTLLRGGEIELLLAESIEPNEDATQWTLRLRPGVRFHNGRPVRAADVVFSLRAMSASPFYGQFLADLDAKGLRAVDGRTVAMPLLRPRADLIEAALSIGLAVFPEGTTDFTRPVGSGPFRVASFEPGSSTVLERNPDYWGGPALLDSVEIRTIPDSAARLNGVLSGELDLAMRVTPAGVRGKEGSALRVVRGDAANADVLGFAMNVTQAPFDDPDVRLACKLACDRQAILDAVLLGEGTVGNDLMGMGLPGYDTSIEQRTHDPDEARRLFAAAGITRLPLKVADLTPGIVSAGEVYAEQLRTAGVTAELQRADPASYFNDYAAFLSTPFQGQYYINRPVAAALPFLSGSRSTFNPSGFATAEYDALLARAQATQDSAARTDLHHQAQRRLWERGGDLLWGYQNVLHATSNVVRDVDLTQSFPYLRGTSLSA